MFIHLSIYVYIYIYIHMHVCVCVCVCVCVYLLLQFLVFHQILTTLCIFNQRCRRLSCLPPCSIFNIQIQNSKFKFNIQIQSAVLRPEMPSPLPNIQYVTHQFDEYTSVLLDRRPGENSCSPAEVASESLTHKHTHHHHHQTHTHTHTIYTHLSVPGCV